MTTEAIEQDASATWAGIAAERAGLDPDRPAQKPVAAPAAATPVEVKPEVDFNAKLAEIENRFSDRLRKAEGHIGNLNGVQMDLRAQLEASKAAANQVSDAPTQAQIKAASADPEKWANLKSQYQDWAEATEEIIDSRISKSFDAKAFEANLRQEMKGQTDAIKKEIINASLDTLSPGWRDESTGQANQQILDWVSGQPQEVKNLALSDHVKDAATLLKLYHESKQSNPTNQITEQRKANLAAATSAPKGKAPAIQKSFNDMTDAEKWDYEAKRRAKQAR